MLPWLCVPVLMYDCLMPMGRKQSQRLPLFWTHFKTGDELAQYCFHAQRYYNTSISFHKRFSIRSAHINVCTVTKRFLFVDESSWTQSIVAASQSLPHWTVIFHARCWIPDFRNYSIHFYYIFRCLNHSRKENLCFQLGKYFSPVHPSPKNS